MKEISHPAVLLADKSAKRDRQHIWEAMRVCQSFGVTELLETVNRDAIPAARTTRGKVLSYVSALVKAGYLREFGDQAPVRYVLVRNPGIQAPQVKRNGDEMVTGPVASERIWCAARALGVFSVNELVATAEVNLATVWEYVSCLEKAGYFLKMAKRGDGNVQLWQFSREKDSGPEAPQLVTVKAVKDPNQDSFVWAENRAGGLV